MVGFVSSFVPAGMSSRGGAAERRIRSRKVGVRMTLSRREFLTSVGGAAVGLGVGAPEKSLAQWSAFELPRSRGENESIFDTSIGSYLPPRPRQLLKKKQERLDRVVVIGETHTNPLHHRAELEVIQALRELDPRRPMVIGLEHFYRKHQTYLDAFVDGKISLTKLHALTDWERTFGYEFNMWAPIFNYCQDEKIRLVGLNLPYQVVHAVSERGLENLPQALLDLLPEMDLQNARHQARFRENMGLSVDGHGGNHGFDANSVAYQRYYQAATLWDEYMADSASLWLKQNKDSQGRIVVLAGAAHVAGRDGIPDRITRRTGCECFTILPQGVQWVNHTPQLREYPRKDMADWIWYTQREIDLV